MAELSRVLIVTGLRIQALYLVNSPDVTYSKGYLGFLSMLGAFLSIITCCIPLSFAGFRKFLEWTRFSRLAARLRQQLRQRDNAYSYVDSRRTVILGYLSAWMSHRPQSRAESTLSQRSLVVSTHGSIDELSQSPGQSFNGVSTVTGESDKDVEETGVELHAGETRAGNEKKMTNDPSQAPADDGFSHFHGAMITVPERLHTCRAKWNGSYTSWLHEDPPSTDSDMLPSPAEEALHLYDRHQFFDALRMHCK